MKWLPLSILVAAAALLRFSWDELPARWAVHWGLGGRPDGWATKTPLGVFGPLVLAAAILISFEILAQVLERKAAEQAAVAILPLRIIATSVALVFAGASVWLPLVQPSTPWAFIGFTVVVVGVGLAASVITSAKILKRSTIGRAPEQGWQGFIYRNAKDDRLWVPKRFGWGWTLNFAHRGAWLTLLLLLSPAIVGLVMAFLSAARR